MVWLLATNRDGGGTKFILKVLILILLITLIKTDLPSCYRARCSHCNVQFIAKMCNSVCSSCENFDPQNLELGQKIRPAIAQKKADTTNQARVYGQPINVPYDSNSSQRGPSYETYQEQQNHAPYAHQLPPTEIASNTGNNNNYAINNQQNSNQAIGFGSSYTPYNNLNKPQTPYSPQFQPQQIQNSFNPFYNPQQPFGTTQNQQVSQQQPLFVNPFQPFLQQTYQVQQYQSFTPAPVTLASFPTFTMPTFPTLPTVTSSPSQKQQLNYLQPQNQQQTYTQTQVFPAYSQAQVVAPSPVLPTNSATSKNQYVYKTQQTISKDLLARPTQVATPEYQQPERPKQIYNQGSYSTNNAPQIKQPDSQIATNIDTSSIYINKNTYEDKKKGYVTQTCPKQPNWEPCISKELANERFRNCCQRLGEGCSSICNYDQQLATLQLAVLTGRCPLAKVADVMLCASGYEDATACCQAYNVFEAGFEHCRPYCNPAGGLPNDGMLAEKYRCLGKLSQIQRCFYASQKP